MFQMFASLICASHGGIVYAGGTPFLIVVKISPSVAPWSHFSSVRLLVTVEPIASPPLPLARWHTAQYFSKLCFPAASESVVAGVGLVSLAASGLPPDAEV